MDMVISDIYWYRYRKKVDEVKRMKIREIVERFGYWIFQTGKGCRRCCLRCEYYDICQWDVRSKRGKDKEDSEHFPIMKRRKRKHEKF